MRTSWSIISTYVPPTGTTCDVNLIATNGGDCSIFAGNSINFDNGTDGDLTDKVAILVYTPGKMAIKNNALGDGALYAGSLDVKNGFDVQYNARIATGPGVRQRPAAGTLAGTRRLTVRTLGGVAG